MRKWLGGMAALIVLLAPASCTKSPRTSPGNATGLPDRHYFVSDEPGAPDGRVAVGHFPNGLSRRRRTGNGSWRSHARGDGYARGRLPPRGRHSRGTATPAGTAPGAGSPKQTIAVAGDQAVPAAAVVPRQNTDVTSLLTLGRDSRILPEDFKIGQMGDARAGTRMSGKP